MDWLRWLWHPYNVFMLVLFGVHVVLFLGLCVSRRRQIRRLASHLEDILGPRFRRISNDPDRTIDEVIDGFFHDIQDVITDRQSPEDARELSRRLVTKDEARKYLKRMSFETLYSCVRAGIEAWPLLGILGTVVAIALGMHASAAAPQPTEPPAIVQPATGPAAAEPPAPAPPAPPPPQPDEATPTGAIIRNFRMAIGSTILGLAFGVGFMLFNAWVEPSFERLMEHRKSIRTVVRTAKNALFGTVGSGELP